MSEKTVSEPLLDVRHLTVQFGAAGQLPPAVNDVSFHVAPGETLGLVGESGSGKSITAFSILRLLPPAGRIVSGEIRFEGRDLLTLDEREMQAIRGARISLVFQEPMTALNPVMRVGEQVAEALYVHGQGRAEARQKAVELLDAVRIPEPARRAREYPHQLSGGMRQRVMIAIALACTPPLVIADEPTTALDVTIQAQILDLLRELKSRFNLALLLITHDFGVIAEMADRVAVMHKGRIVEQGPVRQILRAPADPYTQRLLAAVPGRAMTPILDVRGLTKHFASKSGMWRSPTVVKAVDGVDFTIDEGEMFGLVGESGCGKSTTGRCILRLVEPTAGEVRFRGENVLEYLARAAAQGAARHADRLSGSVLVAQSPDARGRHRRGAAGHPQAGVARRTPGAGGRTVRAGGPGAGPPRPLPARIQRRAAAAHRHRAGAGAQSLAHRGGRGGVGAGCVHPGAGGPAPAGSAGQVQADVSLHRARPAAGGAHLPPGGGDVPGPDRRDGRHALPLRQPHAPLHAGRSSAPFPCSIPTRHGTASSWIRPRSCTALRYGKSPPDTGRRRKGSGLQDGGHGLQHPALSEVGRPALSPSPPRRRRSRRRTAD